MRDALQGIPHKHTQALMWNKVATSREKNGFRYHHNDSITSLICDVDFLHVNTSTGWLKKRAHFKCANIDTIIHPNYYRGLRTGFGILWNSEFSD